MEWFCELSSAIVDSASSATGGSTRGMECRRRMCTRSRRAFFGIIFGDGTGSRSPLSNGRTYTYTEILLDCSQRVQTFANAKISTKSNMGFEISGLIRVQMSAGLLPKCCGFITVKQEKFRGRKRSHFHGLGWFCGRKLSQFLARLIWHQPINKCITN